MEQQQIQNILDEFANSRVCTTKNFGYIQRMRYIYLYHKDGRFAMKFQCAQDLANYFGYKHFNNTKQVKMVGNYIIKYFYTNQLTPEQIAESEYKNLSWANRNKKIVQLDLNGNYIRTFNGIKEASNAIGCRYNNISLALRRENKIAKGFKWKWQEDVNNS
jgi:hypothetical protein